MSEQTEVTLTQTLKGQTVQNVLHFLNPDGQMDLQTIANLMSTEWIPIVRTIQGTQLVYQQILVRDLGQPNLAPFVQNTAIAGSATGFDSRLPPLCIVIQKKTNTAGRRGRGRMYISGWDNGSIQDTGTWVVGHLNGVMLDAVNNLMAKFFLGGQNSVGLQLCVAGKGPDNQWIFIPVTNLTVRPIPGYQRRRNIGIGI